MVEPEAYRFVAEVLAQLHGRFEKMTPDKIRRILNPTVATTLAVELQALSASLSEPYSWYLGEAARQEYAVKNKLDEIYLRERSREAVKMSQDDANVTARHLTMNERIELEDMKQMVIRLRNILDRADKLSSALQSHAASLRTQGVS